MMTLALYFAMLCSSKAESVKPNGASKTDSVGVARLAPLSATSSERSGYDYSERFQVSRFRWR